MFFFIDAYHCIILFLQTHAEKRSRTTLQFRFLGQNPSTFVWSSHGFAIGIVLKNVESILEINGDE